MTHYYDYMEEKLSKINGWQHIIFAAACAERFAPLCRQFEEPYLVGLFDEGLEKVWCVAKGEEADMNNLYSKIQFISHYSEEAKSVGERFANDTWSLLHIAFDIVLLNDSYKNAVDASKVSLGLAGSMDFYFSQIDPIKFGERTNPYSPNCLQAKEFVAQKELTFRLISQRTIDSQIVTTVRQQSKQILTNALQEDIDRLRPQT
jgi:Protein of unknown function (DUF416)